MLTLNTVHTGDAAELFQQLEPQSLDLIFTDNPYARKYFNTFEILAENSARVLKNGGSLVAILPHYLIEEIMLLFAAQPKERRLKWRWLLSMDQDAGPHPRMAMGVEVCHKPIGWWVKRAYPQGRGFLRDQVKIIPPDKTHHEWEQDLTWCSYYIEKLCPPSGVILDPFVGSGTLGVAAESLARSWLGFEIDPVTAQTARDRIEMARRSRVSLPA